MSLVFFFFFFIDNDNFLLFIPETHLTLLFLDTPRIGLTRKSEYKEKKRKETKKNRKKLDRIWNSIEQLIPFHPWERENPFGVCRGSHFSWRDSIRILKEMLFLLRGKGGKKTKKNRRVCRSSKLKLEAEGEKHGWRTYYMYLYTHVYTYIRGRW